MKSNGTRTITFLSGILLGMLAALGLVFLLLNDFNPLRYLRGLDSENSRDTVIINQRGKIRVVPAKLKSQRPIEKIEISTVKDSLDQAAVMSDSQQLGDQYSDLEEIVVKRDELIATFPLQLILVEKQFARSKSDSLIRNFQGESNKPTEYRIEFWRSPVNFRGFKFVRNAVVVFGLYSEEPVKLYSLDEKLYFRHGTQVYKLYITEKFESFSRVTDESILKQLR